MKEELDEEGDIPKPYYDLKKDYFLKIQKQELKHAPLYF